MGQINETCVPSPELLGDGKPEIQNNDNYDNRNNRNRNRNKNSGDNGNNHLRILFQDINKYLPEDIVGIIFGKYCKIKRKIEFETCINLLLESRINIPSKLIDKGTNFFNIFGIIISQIAKDNFESRRKNGKVIIEDTYENRIKIIKFITNSSDTVANFLLFSHNYEGYGIHSQKKARIMECTIGRSRMINAMNSGIKNIYMWEIFNVKISEMEKAHIYKMSDEEYIEILLKILIDGNFPNEK